MATKEHPRIYLLAAVFAVLGGCVSTSPVANSATTPVPQERRFSNDYSAAEPGGAHVIVKRDAGFVGSGCDFVVKVQGTPLASLRPSERIDLYLKPGHYILGATEGCGHTAVIEVETQVAAGDLRTYRLELDGELDESMTFRFMPTTNE